MKNKILLFIGIIIIIFSIWSLFEYQKMEERMPKFKAYDNLSWIMLFVGILMVIFFIFINRKNKKN
jgi:uncharacterized membrane protein YidH (DUF202 family)